MDRAVCQQVSRTSLPWMQEAGKELRIKLVSVKWRGAPAAVYWPGLWLNKSEPGRACCAAGAWVLCLHIPHACNGSPLLLGDASRHSSLHSTRVIHDIHLRTAHRMTSAWMVSDREILNEQILFYFLNITTFYHHDF